MKSNHPEFFIPDSKKLKELWEQATFVFDASSLLDCYRLSEKTVNQYLRAIESVKDKVWLPYQADFEFSKNRNVVVEEQINKFPQFGDCAVSIENVLKKGDSDPKHPLASLQQIREKAKQAIDVISEIEPLVNLAKDDFRKRCISIDERLDNLFANKIACIPANFENMKLKAEERYQKLIPPGFLDWRTKGDDHRKERDSPTGKILGDPYGDAIIWLEMLQSPHKHLIFITSDMKQDWWWKLHGRTAPRPELLKEMGDYDKHFYMYSLERFMQFALEALETNKPQEKEITEAVEEVRSLGQAESNANFQRMKHDLSAKLLQFSSVGSTQELFDAYKRLLSALREKLPQVRPSADLEELLQGLVGMEGFSLGMGKEISEVAKTSLSLLEHEAFLHPDEKKKILNALERCTFYILTSHLL